MAIIQKKSQLIDDYIASFPENVQRILKRFRQAIRNSAPESIETINYGIPTFKLNDKNLVHFAAFKNHIGFYPTPSAIVIFKKELAPYKQAKGSVQFPIDKPVPLDLVKKIVKSRVKENLGIEMVKRIKRTKITKITKITKRTKRIKKVS